MDKYKVFRDETYVYYVDANSLEEAQEILSMAYTQSETHY